MIKGSFKLFTVCQSLCSDIERFCYIIWTNRKETERANEKKVEIYWMLWTQLTKFFQWKWIDVKILRRQTLGNDDDNNGNEEKLYTLHKSFKPLFFHWKIHLFLFLVRRVFFSLIMSPNLIQNLREKKSTQKSHKMFSRRMSDYVFVNSLMLSTTDAARSHAICFAAYKQRSQHFLSFLFLSSSSSSSYSFLVAFSSFSHSTKWYHL